MDEPPLAYHITIGTYGTRLHGDERGTVDRKMNQPGDPIIGKAPEWEMLERSLLRFPPVVLTDEQRLFIENIMPAICDKGGWVFVNCAARRDHVHVQLKGSAEGKAIRRWLKTWLGQELSSKWPRPEGATWWAECGSVKWIWTDDYLNNVHLYIDDQRTTPRT